MLVVSATFVLCAAIVLGSYWMFVVRPEQRAARALKRRLSAATAAPEYRTELTKKAPPLSAVRLLDELLARSELVVTPLQRLITFSALPLTVGAVLLACGLTGMVTFLALELSSSPLWMAALVALAMTPVPYWCLRHAARRRIATLEEQFPQAVDLISASLRAGHALPTALLMVAEEVADPLGSEFRLLHDQQNFGKPLPDVLKGLTDRIPLLDVRIFVTAVLTQRETGGNLAEVLDKLAAVIRDRFKIRRQVRAVSAHGRITGWVLTALPPVVAGALYLIAPDHLMTLITDPLGLQITAGAVGLQIIGTLAIRRIVAIEL